MFQNWTILNYIFFSYLLFADDNTVPLKINNEEKQKDLPDTNKQMRTSGPVTKKVASNVTER